MQGIGKERRAQVFSDVQAELGPHWVLLSKLPGASWEVGLSPHDQLTGSHPFLNLKKGPGIDSTVSGITGVTEIVSAQFQPLRGGAFLLPHSQSLLSTKDRSSATP